MLAQIVSLNQKIAAQSVVEGRRATEKACRRMFWVALLAALAALAVALYVNASITRPMGQALQLIETVAAGDRTGSVTVTARDDTGQLLTVLGVINANLTNIVGKFREGTDMIATGSSQIAAGNFDLSSRTEEQASTPEETAASMEEQASTVDSVGHVATGSRLVNQAGATMTDVVASVRRVTDVMTEIVGASQKQSQGTD